MTCIAGTTLYFLFSTLYCFYTNFTPFTVSLSDISNSSSWNSTFVGRPIVEAACARFTRLFLFESLTVIPLAIRKDRRLWMLMFLKSSHPLSAKAMISFWIYVPRNEFLGEFELHTALCLSKLLLRFVFNQSNSSIVAAHGCAAGIHEKVDWFRHRAFVAPIAKNRK